MSDTATAAPVANVPSAGIAPGETPTKTPGTAPPVPVIPPGEVKPPEPKPEVDKSKMETLRLQSELKRQKDAIAAKQKEVDAATARLKAIDDAKASGKPALALKALGFDDAKIAELLVNSGEPADEVATLKAQLAEVRGSFDEYRKKFDTAQTEREQEATKVKEAELASQRKAFVERYHTQEDKFPLLAATQNGALILAEIARHHEETGEVLEADDAAARVEKHLSESVPSQIDAFLGKKALREMIKARLAKLETPEAPPAETKAADTQATEPPPERKLETPARQKWSVRPPTLNGGMQRGTPPPANGKASKDDVWAEVRAKYPGR